jgi:hypothetical protein
MPAQMPAFLYAALIQAFGAMAVCSMISDLRAGSTTNRGMTIEARDNPGGFYLVQASKAAFGCFAAASLLHSVGWIGDPVTWIHQTLPFLRFR